MPEESEITTPKLARQDKVDNSIYQLVNELMPNNFPQLSWNQEWISLVREKIEDLFIQELSINAEEKENFSMLFYPFIADKSVYDELSEVTQMNLSLIIAEGLWTIRVDGKKEAGGTLGEGQTIITFNTGKLKEEFIYSYVEMGVI